MRQVFQKLFMVLLLLLFVSSVFGDDNTLKQRIQNAGDASAFPDDDLIVVFDSTHVKVMDSGLSCVRMHVLTKVLTSDGAIALSVRQYGYDPLSAHVDVLKVRVFRKNGEIEEIPLSAVLDHAAPARMIYWGAREKMVPVGRLEPGDALETIVFRKGFTYALLNQNETEGDERYIPPMRGHFYDIVPFWDECPILLKSYTVSLPSDKPVQYQVYNGEVTSSVKFKNDQTVYHWEKSNIPAFEREPNMVAESDVATKLLISTSPDWEAKSRWFYGVNEDYGSFVFTPEIKAKVDELTIRCKTDFEKADVLTHWVAEEIRYSGLSMGPGEGYTLHSGEMNFRDRCGVCKDKAGMLIAMLRAAGMESYAAMTMAGSRIDRIPADQFNHSVTIWKRGEGDFVLLDPTWVPGVRELWSSAEQQQQYLMGLPEGADLRTTPISPPENHYFRVRGKSKLLIDGAMTGTITIEAEGQSDAGIRRMLRRWISEQQAFFDEAVYAVSPRIKVSNFKYHDPYDLMSQPMKISFDYQIPKYALLAGNRMVFTPVVATHLFSNRAINSYLHMDFTDEKKAFGFRTRCSKFIDFEESVTLPSGCRIDFLPTFQSESGEAADFNASYKISGRRLVFDQKLKLKKRIYEAEDWPNFRKAVSSSKDVSDEFVVLINE